MKGGRVFVIPGRLRNRNAFIRMKRVRKEDDQAVETKEHGRGAVDGQIGPLALGFDPQVSSALLESRFQAPAFHEGLYDLLGSLRLRGGKQRFRRVLALGITSENPADGQRLVSLAIPQSGPRADFQGAFSLPIPLQGELLPRRVRISQDLFERGETLADHTRTPNGMAIACGWELIQSGILMRTW